MRQGMPSTAHATAGAKIVNSRGDQQQSNAHVDADPRAGYKTEKAGQLGAVVGAAAIKLSN
jgi:hypothetical protein